MISGDWCRAKAFPMCFSRWKRRAPFFRSTRYPRSRLRPFCTRSRPIVSARALSRARWRPTWYGMPTGLTAWARSAFCAGPSPARSSARLGQRATIPPTLSRNGESLTISSTCWTTSTPSCSSWKRVCTQPQVAPWPGSARSICAAISKSSGLSWSYSGLQFGELPGVLPVVFRQNIHQLIEFQLAPFGKAERPFPGCGRQGAEILKQLLAPGGHPAQHRLERDRRLRLAGAARSLLSRLGEQRILLLLHPAHLLQGQAIGNIDVMSNLQRRPIAGPGCAAQFLRAKLRQLAHQLQARGYHLRVNLLKRVFQQCHVHLSCSCFNPCLFQSLPVGR